MKSLFEILLIVFIIVNIFYTSLFFFYFGNMCNSFSSAGGESHMYSIKKLATCKDSMVCYPENIKTNNKLGSTSWDCKKKEKYILWQDIYESIINNFINSLTR